jgi:hypothetical protein
MKNLKLLGLGTILFFEKVKPQHNAYIERFNCILQKEFINHHLSLAFQNLEEFLIINFLIIFSGIIIQKDHIIALISNLLYNIQKKILFFNVIILITKSTCLPCLTEGK